MNEQVSHRHLLTGEQAEECQNWDLPQVGGVGLSSKPKPDADTAAQENGYQVGYQQGLQAGQQAGQALVQQLSAILNKANHQLQIQQGEFEKEIVSLAVSMAEQIIRHEVSTQPEKLVSLLEEVFKQIPMGSGQVQVHLNSNDAAILKESLFEQEDKDWQIMEDASLNAGDCRIESDKAQINAEVSQRLQQMMTKIMSDVTVSEPEPEVEQEPDSGEDIDAADNNSETSSDE